MEEEKDFAKEAKMDLFKKQIIEAAENMEEDRINIELPLGMAEIQIEIQKENDGCTLKIFDKEIGRIKDGDIEYDVEGLKTIKNILEKTGYSYKELEDMGFPDLEEAELDIEEEQDDEKGDQEQADEEEPELEEENEDRTEENEDRTEENEDRTEELAQRYNVRSNQVVHISKSKKITKDQNFDRLATFAEGYDDIYIIQGEDPYSWKTIGIRDGQEEEIENERLRQMDGKNPNITVKRIDGEEITEIRPLAMYEIDSNTAIAIVKNSFGEPEALYCRQEGGDERTYWGTVIPEVSGKNVLQKDPETRDFMSYKNNSGRDLVKKADELKHASSLEARGIPSKQKGVQVEEIDGTHTQNMQYYKDQIKENLYERLGILDKMKNAMPGYLEYIDKKLDKQAERIIQLMEENEDITYEEAVKKVESEEKNRDKGGDTPYEKRRPH